MTEEPDSAATGSPLPPTGPTFADFGLSAPLLQAITAVGYEAPTPIQAAAIPPLLAGRDILGQAQTGTGKTAAFALPLLSRLDVTAGLQLLVLTPTRELAIQVAEAMQTYARHLRDFHVLPVYGGQDIFTQLRHLKRGVQVVVGTPGRILDHLRRGTLVFDQLKALVLDEADEMLRMGFIEEVEAILEQTPDGRQIALFSATMPETIKRIARRYLRDPLEVLISSKTATVATVTQRYWPVVGVQKLDALTRILEVEDFEAMLVFVRTRGATVELAEKLEARGFACSPLNGEMSQSLRERTIDRLRNGQLDIVVATDVAARGLDVERITHVVNFDIPHDVEAYVHRIGRTGRAGRQGVAILFAAPREQHILRMIERATRQPIERMRLPTREDIAGRRIAQFKQMVVAALAEQDLDFLTTVIEEIEREQETSPERIAAALTYLVNKERPLVPEFRDEPPPPPPPRYQDRPGPGPRGGSPQQHRPAGKDPQQSLTPRGALVRHRLEVGWDHGAAPKNIVGAIANEAGLDGRFISRLEIRNDYSLVDLPADLPQGVLKRLSQMRVCGQEARLRRLPSGGDGPARESYAEDARPQSGYSKPGYPKGPPKPRPPFRPDGPPHKADGHKPEGPPRKPAGGGFYEGAQKSKPGKPGKAAFVRKPKPPADPAGGLGPKKRKPKPEGSGDL